MHNTPIKPTIEIHYDIHNFDESDINGLSDVFSRLHPTNIKQRIRYGLFSISVIEICIIGITSFLSAFSAKFGKDMAADLYKHLKHKTLETLKRGKTETYKLRFRLRYNDLEIYGATKPDHDKSCSTAFDLLPELYDAAKDFAQKHRGLKIKEIRYIIDESTKTWLPVYVITEDNTVYKIIVND